MDTPTISMYYREPEPMKRKALLDQSIQAGEEPEENRIRQELWDIRYSGKSQVDAASRADGYLAMWMCMEFNRDAGSKLFGNKNTVKEIRKHLDKLKFQEFAERSEKHRELLYRECCHLVKTYIDLCGEDRSYNSTLFGIMTMKKESAEYKLKRDIYETAVRLPKIVEMEKELELITKAAREMYELRFPGEGLPEE